MLNASTRQRLTELVPPPRSPATVDWEAAERALGFALPAGYRWLAETYGPGVFDDFLRLYVPGDGALDLVAGTAMYSGINRSWLADDDPPPFGFDPGRLVVWADTDEREALFWSTDGPPDEWPVIVESFEDLGTWRYDGACEDLLLMLLEGTVEVPYIFTESFDEPHHFTRLDSDEHATLTRMLGSLAKGVRRRLPF